MTIYPLRQFIAVAAIACGTAAAAQDNLQTLLDTRACIGCDLQGIGLMDEALISADMSGSTLTDVDFDGANLFLTVFDGATLDGVSFRNANLRSATFAQATLRNVDFTGADLTGARLNGADMDLDALDAANTCNVTMPDGLASMSSC